MLTFTAQATALSLYDATEAHVHAALDAVADSIPNGSALPDAMVDRWRKAQEGAYPNCLWLLHDQQGPLGWVGWAPYNDQAHTWQSTTYFADRIRGTGLLTPSRCLQVHAQETIRQRHTQTHEAAPTFVSSIATWNTRSYRASHRYATTHHWPDTWTTRYEPVTGRHAWILTWPEHPEHTCTQTGHDTRTPPAGAPNPTPAT